MKLLKGLFTVTAMAACLPAFAAVAPGFSSETLIGPGDMRVGKETAKFEYGYPWGDFHAGAGSAHMRPVNVKSKNKSNTFRITTKKLETPLVVQKKGTSYTLTHQSGAVHYKGALVMDADHPYMGVCFTAEVDPAAGAWPAVWMSSQNGWTAEFDIFELKVDLQKAVNWQNTYWGEWNKQNWQTAKTPWPLTKTSKICGEFRLANGGKDVTVTYKMDGVFQPVQTAKDAGGKNFYLIINTQVNTDWGPLSEKLYTSISDLSVWRHTKIK